MPTIPVFLRAHQYEKLQDIARLRKTTVSAIVREAVDYYLKHVNALRNPTEVAKKKIEQVLGEAIWRKRNIEE